MENWWMNAHQIEPGQGYAANALIQEEVHRLESAEVEPGVDLDQDTEADQEGENSDDDVEECEAGEGQHESEMGNAFELEEEQGMPEPQPEERREGNKLWGNRETIVLDEKWL
jgi:hypothetical protein